MERAEIIFNEKFNIFTNTFVLLENALDRKDQNGDGPLYLTITNTLEQLRFHESNLATIASLHSQPTASELNNRINTVTAQYAETVAKANTLLLDLDTKIAGNQGIPDSDDELQLTSAHTTLFTPRPVTRKATSSNLVLKTPQLSIPTFNGDHRNFPTFWRQFKALIHDDRHLSLQQKSIFLAEALQGPAKVHLENKSLDGKSYDRIIKTLQTTYQPKLKIDYRIYDQLSKLPVTKNDPTSVRCRVNEIRALLDQLDDDHIYNSEDPAWVKIITTRFPTEIINMLCWRTTRATSIKQLLLNIEQTADSMESFSIYSDRSPFLPSHQYQTPKFTPKPNINPSTNLVNKNDRPCVFCDQHGHRSAKCTIITTPQQRRDIIKLKNRCWICFSPTHTSNKCAFEKCRICKKDHHPSLCLPTTSISKTNKVSNMNCTVISPTYHLPAPAYLMTSQISLLNPQTGTYSTRTVFLDPGATQSFIYQPVADACQLHTLAKHKITVTGFSGNQENFETKTVEAIMQTPYGKTINFSLLTSPKPLTGNLKSCNLSLKDREYLESLKIVATNQFINGETFTPDILIGMDLYDTVLIEDPIVRLPSGLKVKHTQLGPCIYGKPNDTDNTINVNTVIVNPQIPEETMIKQLFEIDNLGFSPHEGALNKCELFYNEYATLLKFDNGFITAPLPLKTNAAHIQPNRSLALATLNRLQKTLKQDPIQQSHYQQIINQYLQDTVIEPVPSDSQASMIYYMPHRGVWKSQKTKPLRIVFNASAKQKGQLSLNDVTTTGESFNNKIIDILIGIRTSTYFLMCDIEGAFTQIRIADDCKDLCRFLWLKNLNKPATPDNIAEFRFNRLAFGITASPAVLNMSLHAFLKTQTSPLIEHTLRYLYVDNIFYTTDRKEDLASYHNESKSLFSKVSMNVREYFSNYKTFNDTLPEEDKHPERNPKILGVHYNSTTDMFTLLGQMKIQSSFTKRDLLSSLHSIYDPIGLAAPLLLQYKLLLRQAMSGTINWKDQVPGDIVKNWNDTSQKIGPIKIQLQRQLTEDLVSKEIWIFVDASISAIATCAYCTSPNKRTPLILGKVKLAPKNRGLTIPRLELSALLMGMKIAETISNNWKQPNTRINIASDSQIALSWLFTKKNIPVFVSNLRQHIEQIARRLENQTASLHYHYVDTKHNPADIGTRGTTNLETLRDQWLLSPTWLSQPDNRPITELSAPLEEEEPTMLILPVLTTPTITDNLLDPSKYHSYTKLQQVTSLVLKAATTLLRKIKKVPASPILSSANTEWDKSQSFKGSAELLLIKDAQRHLEQKDIKQFRTTRNSYGLIIIHTRLVHADLPHNSKFPYLLPKKAPLGKTILHSLHQDNAHAGVNHLLTLFLQHFYMPAARQVCKSIIKRCVPCQKLLSRPFHTEFHAPLPEDRITKAMPFRHTGLDCIGPIKYNKNKQIYIVIFTCLTIRAVHLEPIIDMSSTTFLNAFIRFVARRGLPDVVRSDNGSNFTHSAKILSLLETYDPEHRTSFTKFLESHHITWIFNTPSAPWTGGVWERLVAIVKSALYKSLNLKLVNTDQLTTAIIKIEGIINSRPLTYTNSDNVDEGPLTPADFLTQGSPVLIPGGSVDKLGEALDQPNAIQTNKEAFENLQKVDIITEVFWQKWAKEYLLSLRHNHMSRKCSSPRALGPQLNEIVLVEDDSLNRINWNMARVTELLPSSDRITRTVKIKLGNGKELLKPVEKLYPLELKEDLTLNKTQHSTAVNHSTTIPFRNSKILTNIFRFLILMQLFFLATTQAHKPTILCTTSHVIFPAQPEPSTICIGTVCHQLPGNQAEDIQLKVSATPRTVSVSRTISDRRQSQSCHLPHPCDFPPPRILHILGNPHCNPSLAILLVLATIIGLSLLCISVGYIFNGKKRTTPRERSEPTVSYIPSVLFTILALATTAQACNELHTRKNIDLLCDDLHNCSTIKSEEIPFNPLLNSFCSVIKFQNATIGKLEIDVIGNTFTCNKVTQGYTRVTNLTIHATQRCAGTGDCPWGTGCDEIRSNTFITELAQAYNNPGQTYCTRAGGGLFKGCGLPIEGCILFRPTYQPISEDVFEEISCAQWNQEINVQMRIEYLNNSHNYELALQPYKKYELHGVTLHASSTSTQVISHLPNTLFLVSNKRSFMIPERKKPAVICGSRQSAAYDFKNCLIRKPCNCLGAAAQLSCNCESVTNRELETMSLPRTTPNYRISNEEEKIRITSWMEETTITMENPNYNMETLFTNRYPCHSDFQVITGCYKCKDGVEFNITCKTQDELFAILQCDSFSRPIRCSNQNPSSTVKLFFDTPNVEENCTLSCGTSPKQHIRLSARLHYVFANSIDSEADVITHNNKSGIAWNLPNFEPLASLLIANWKWITPILAAITALTYFGWSSATLILPAMIPTFLSYCCLKQATSKPPAAVSGNV